MFRSFSRVGRFVTQMANNPSPKICARNNVPDKYLVVFARHGESEWNRKNIFCGWYDAELSDEGTEQACMIGEILKEHEFDIVFTSLLKRAYNSVDIVLKKMERSNLPVVKGWQLNERHYGALTGFNKADTAEKYGTEQVQIWRRSYDVLPPPMEKDHPFYEAIVNNPIFRKHGLHEENIPKSESLKTTQSRVAPFWDNAIVPKIKAGQRVLVIAHGTSLRGLVKHIENLSDAEIVKLNIPTGIPFSYSLNNDMKPSAARKFFCDDETLEKLMAKVADIGSK